MTSLSHIPLITSTAGPGGSADGSFDGNSGGRAASAPVTSTEDLLRYLPVDRRHHSSDGLVEASYTIPGECLTQFSIGLGVNQAVFFEVVFAILLARLTGQESVTLHDRSQNSSVRTLTFKPQSTLSTLLADISGSCTVAPVQPCGSEFFYSDAEADAVEPALSSRVLRMSIHHLGSNKTVGAARVSLASTTGVWSSHQLRLWLRYFDHLLTVATTSPFIPWKSLPLLDPADIAAIYESLNRTTVPLAADSLVHDLVARQAKQTPSAIAIESQWRRFTYQQLQAKTLVIAHYLQKFGAGPNQAVAVCMERGIDLPVALLAVLASGSFYVPLDPQEAPQRLATILEECRPVAIIADRMAAFPATVTTPIIYLDEVPDLLDPQVTHLAALTASDTAYTIYTSGTTGKPKGVAISHGSLTNVLQSFLREPGFVSSDRMLAVSPISFDIATLEMLLPLLVGGTVVVADRLIASDPFRLATMLTKFEITVLQATPATWRLLHSSDWEGKPNLRMISGGEALPRDLANRLLPLGAELWNCYGPTETTIWSSVLRIHEESGIVPIGPPLANTTFYVLDEDGGLLPPGVRGELYIGGVGVSSGYVNRPQLSQQRFLPDPFAEVASARMFRTGDLVRLGNGNELEFFGRLDSQVKLRGYRIELGEIESVMRAFPGIDNAVAGLPRNLAGEPYLVAWFTVAHEQLDLKAMRKYLSQHLPSYMLPTRFVLVDAMPLTTSGKIDRNALLNSDFEAALPVRGQDESAKPDTDLEQKLLQIFREVLNAIAFGVTDSFFDFGGYSLLTVELFTRIHRKLGVDLPISALFDAPTVRGLAKIIEQPEPLPTIVPIRPQGESAPLFVIHSYLLYGVLPKIVEPGRPVYGVRELNTSVGQTVEDRATEYVKEILDVSPGRPIVLIGWCAAGWLTVEIARQLRSLGHEIGLVALFDAERPGFHPTAPGNRLSRLRAHFSFHTQRLRGASLWRRIEYFWLILLRQGDTVLEALFLRWQTFVLRLRSWFGLSLPNAIFNNSWRTIAATKDYLPANYPGKIVLFRATDIPQLPGGDETLGWNEVVDEGVEVVYVPGDHETMFLDPHVEVFRKHLRLALRVAG